MKTNATIAQLNEALKELNKNYDGNISFREIEQVNSKRVKFTLKAISKKKGARISTTGRNLPFASWHVHGDFFDILFSIDENIYIWSAGKKITKDNGNWEDRNVGSNFHPMYFSETSIQ
jgi:hypothetical protein